MPPVDDKAKTPDDSFRVQAPQLNLPKGGGAIRGIGEKFAANPATGTGSLTIPIFTSPGRSGFGPELSLSYNSGSGNSQFGFGWSLTRSKRSTKRRSCTSWRPTTVNMNDKADMSGNNDPLTKNPLMGNLLNGSLNKIVLPSAITDATHPPLTVYFGDNSMEDLWMAVSWGT